MKGFGVGVTPQKLRGRLAWLAEMMRDFSLDSIEHLEANHVNK